MNNTLLIGYGYWGKIILKNLIGMDELKGQVHVYDKHCDFNTITLPDGATVASSLTEELLCTIDTAFVIVPSTQHYDICSTLLNHDINVFCEKPLCSNSWQAEQLHKIAIERGVTLFTDWIFTYNDQVRQIKKDYERGALGKIKSIRMKRLNSGPERFDVDARWDLASHDVSIVQYIFGNKEPGSVSWKNYKQNHSSSQNDSTFGFIDYGDFKVMVDASWEYGEKERTCIFEFDSGFAEWDDTKAYLRYYNTERDIVLVPETACSPLKKSIQSFFSMSTEKMIEQHQLTITTLKILEK